ncbi:ABC transporter ATP-binding protein [Prosthecochloris sp.]|uniref:ABC transporter ATP-binding protein n=1 Tax=Prosthecochloris sp. TaxID=290513 RepID=UPI0025D52662|nr:ABC transporter ATP-binding protein [Prosthecochloris sp.]
MLKANDVTKNFNSHIALNNVSLSVTEGQIYCLLGANGAGKTTLINHFLGFLKPTSGEVLVNGKNVMNYPLETKRDIAYIPENVMLYGVLTGLENLEYFSALATGRKKPKDLLMKLLTDVGLRPEDAVRRVSTYSKGMRQKVGIAIAMAKNAKALLLDEPTSGLDPKAANEFSLLLKKAAENGVAVFTTTHDLFHAKETGSRIGIMRSGSMLAEFSSDDVSHTDMETIYLKNMRD